MFDMKFDYNRIKDPGYFAENRMPAHSDHLCYASMEELAAGESSLRLSLNGPWKFHYALNITQAPEGFEHLPAEKIAPGCLIVVDVSIEKLFSRL